MTSPNKVKNIGWQVTFAGLGINLALGILYTWSVIRGGIPEEWGWIEDHKALPYSVACLVFSLIMVPAGRMQDKLSPRLVATIGGILVGVGMIICSMSGSSVSGYVIGFGVLAGAGIGFGYASATPPAVKWFPAAKTGLIAGLVVSGFGLASAYAAPLTNALIERKGLESTIMYLGIGFLIIVVLLAQFLKTPPEGYVPEGTPPPDPSTASNKVDYKPSEMLKTWQFWALWFMYACGAGAGLMVISMAKSLGKEIEAGIFMVMALAIGNGGGRVIAGMVSDKIGRKATLILFLLIQAGAIILLSISSPENFIGTLAVSLILIALVGANYGSNLALFPSFTKDFYGLKNFGMNYGLIFTAWGVGGFMLSQLAAMIFRKTGSYTYSYYISAGLLVCAAVLTVAIKKPETQELASDA